MPIIPAELARAKAFPVMPGDKLPALSYGWQTRATNDNAQLAQWDAGMANLNWGINAGASGLFVFDVDPSGLDRWNELQATIPGLREAVAASYTVRTPRGGYHHYFEGFGPTTAGAIAPGIDTRGGYVDERTGKLKSLGYVVAPGSKTVAGPKTVDGEYVALGGSIFPMPAPVLQLVPEKKKGAALGLARDVDKDNPRNIKTARDLLENYVRDGNVSVEGHGGDNTAFKVAASILDKGISPGMAYELLDEMWNPHCSPPWEDWELEQKINNALKHGEETESGAKGFETNENAFAHFAGQTVADDPVTPKRKFRLQLIHDYAASVKDPTWLIKDFLPAQGTGILYGYSGSFKSFIALDMALCLAYGHAGQWGAPPVKHDVIYFAGESPRGAARFRKPAWQAWQGLDGNEDHRFFLYPYVPPFQDKEQWEDIRQQIEELGIRPSLMITDTMTRLMTGMDENATKDANQITSFLENQANHYDCFNLAVHHTGKDESRGARGNSAFYSNLDTALYLKKKNGGVALTVKNHKEADPKDGETLFKKEEFGNSIVLRMVDSLNEDTTDRTVTSKGHAWASRNEVVERITKITKGSGQRISEAHLLADIAAEFHLDEKRIRSILNKNEELKLFRPDRDGWQIPGMEGYDL